MLRDSNFLLNLGDIKIEFSVKSGKHSTRTTLSFVQNRGEIKGEKKKKTLQGGRGGGGGELRN